MKVMGSTAIRFPSGGVQICQYFMSRLLISTVGPLGLPSLRQVSPWVCLNRSSYWFCVLICTSVSTKGTTGSRVFSSSFTLVVMLVSMCRSRMFSWLICRQGWQPKHTGKCTPAPNSILTVSRPSSSTNTCRYTGRPSGYSFSGSATTSTPPSLSTVLSTQGALTTTPCSGYPLPSLKTGSQGGWGQRSRLTQGYMRQLPTPREVSSGGLRMRVVPLRTRSRMRAPVRDRVSWFRGESWMLRVGSACISCREGNKQCRVRIRLQQINTSQSTEIVNCPLLGNSPYSSLQTPYKFPTKVIGSTAMRLPSPGVQNCQYRISALLISTFLPSGSHSRKQPYPGCWNKWLQELVGSSGSGAGVRGSTGSRVSGCRGRFRVMLVQNCSAERGWLPSCKQGWQPKQTGRPLEAVLGKYWNLTVSLPFSSTQLCSQVGSPSATVSGIALTYSLSAASYHVTRQGLSTTMPCSEWDRPLSQPRGGASSSRLTQGYMRKLPEPRSAQGCSASITVIPDRVSLVMRPP